METLVTQLREVAETSVVPQEEEKGEKVPIIMRIENPDSIQRLESVDPLITIHLVSQIPSIHSSG